MAGDKEIQRIIEAGIDIITAGFPCQDISYAGKGAGLEGARSGLWFDALDTICMVGPRFALLENVPALLKRGMGEVLGGLAEGGYDAQWDCIPAAAVGADHERDRIFIIARSRINGSQERMYETQLGIQKSQTEQKRREDNRIFTSQKIKYPDTQFGEFPLGRKAGRMGRFFKSFPRHRNWTITSKPVLGRGEDGIPHRVDRIRALGNAVVPQVAEYVGERLIEWLCGIELKEF